MLHALQFAQSTAAWGPIQLQKKIVLEITPKMAHRNPILKRIPEADSFVCFVEIFRQGFGKLMSKCFVECKSRESPLKIQTNSQVLGWIELFGAEIFWCQNYGDNFNVMVMFQMTRESASV